MKKITIVFIVVTSFVCQLSAVPLNDELIVLHHATTAEMNAIISPIKGSLIFNTDENEVYERNATAWNKISSNGSETKIVAGNCIDITGIGTQVNPYVVKDKSLGETQSTAGTTCKDIFDNGCNVRDGVYWINPNGGSTSDAFEVYCDMTISGGGWTKVGYTSDLEDKNYLAGGDHRDWLPTNFSLSLTDTQINDIRTASTEAKQRYVGKCDGVLSYEYGNGSYSYAFGFRFHTGYESPNGQQNYTGTDITVTQDGCRTNTTYSSDTIFEIKDLRLPIINVSSRDNGGTSETFGSPLTNNPAWFR